MRKLLRTIGLGIPLLLAACEDKPASPETGPDAHFNIRVGEKTVQIRIACTPAERQQGLMHLKTMPEHKGMLFPSREPEPQGFWMKNTLIPLDIGYFTSDGILREVHPMYPRNLDSVKSKRDDIRYALEMNQGWFRKNAIAPGAKLNLEDLAEALEARGQNPVDWIR